MQQLDVTPTLYWNGSSWTQTSSFPDATLSNNNTAWSLDNVDLTNTGDYRITLLAHDNAGNFSKGVDNPRTNFTVGSADTTLPTAQATSPSDGGSILPGISSVSGTAFDADSGIDRVRVRVQQLDVSPTLYWNGSAWTPSSAFLEATLSNNNTAWTLANVDLNNTGDYRITLLAYDNAGNLARGVDNPRNDFSVAVADTTLPTAQATSPSDGGSISPATTSVSGTAFDADSGIDRVRVRVQQLDVSPTLYWNGSAWTPSSAFLEATLSNNNAAWTLANVDLNNTGDYRITLLAYDNAGNLARGVDNPRTDFSVE